MQDYRKLKVWLKAHEMVLETYKVMSRFPKEEKYGLVTQIRRSATSVPSNIVEGSARSSSGDFLRFLQIAFGSCSELEYQLFLSKELDYVTWEQFNKLNQRVVEVKRMLNGLISTVSGR